MLSTSLTNSSPSVNISHSNALNVSTLSSAQVILEGLGFTDQRSAMYAQEQAQHAESIQLRDAIKNYEEYPNAFHQKKLIDVLRVTIKKMKRECSFVKAKQIHYRQLAVQENQNTSSSIGYLNQFGQWVKKEVKQFFGSDSTQLAERYAGMMRTREQVLQQLQEYFNKIAAENHAEEVFEKLIEPNTEQSHRVSRQLSSAIPLTDEFQLIDNTGEVEIGVQPNDNFVIAYEMITDYGPNTYDWRLYAKCLNSDGTPQGAAFPVSTARGYDAKIGIQPNGDFIIIWGQQDHELHARRYNAHCVALGTEFLLGKEYTDLAVGMQSSRNFIVACRGDEYTAHPTIIVQRFDSSGSALSPESRVAGSDSKDVIMETNAVGVLSNDDFIVFGRSINHGASDTTSLLGWRFNAAGIFSGKVFRLPLMDASEYQRSLTRISIAMQSNGHFMMTLAARRKIVAKYFGVNGVPLNSFVIDGSDSDNPICVFDEQGSSTVVQANGNFVFSWVAWCYRNSNVMDNYVFAQRYSADGASLKEKFQVNQLLTNGLSASVIGAQQNNDVMVMWTSQQLSPNFHLVKMARRYHFDDVIPSSYVSPYEYALMSVHVYRKLKDNAVLPAGWKVGQRKFSGGWEIALDSQVNSGNYFGSAYINPSRKALVIAHRGTDFTSISDLYNDLKIWEAQVLLQLEDAYDFCRAVNNFVIENAKTYGNINDYEISDTGHSKGAEIADLSATLWQRVAVSFESPGIVKVLEKNPQRFPNRAMSITNYNAAPNVIDTVNGPIDKLYRIYSPFDRFSFYCPSPDVVCYGLYSINDQHSKNKILQQFNPQTGEPKITAWIEHDQWPEWTGYNAYRDYDQNRYYWDKYIGRSVSDRYRKEFIDRYLTRSNKPGVTNLGDNSDNEFWGGTNSADVMTGGSGNDIYWPFEGRNIISDKKGDDVYQIISTDKAETIIDDEDHKGTILIDEEYELRGNASRASVPNLYILELKQRVFPFAPWPKKIVKYCLVENVEAKTLQILFPNNYNNQIMLKNFVNGQFGIYLESTQLKNYQVSQSAGATSYVASSNVYFVGLGSDETVIVEALGGNHIYTGGNRNKIVYTKPASNKKSLKSQEPDVIEKFNYDDRIVLQGYQEGEYQLQVEDRDTQIVTRDLPLITLLNSPRVVAFYNVSLKAVQIMRDAEPPILLENKLIIRQGEAVTMNRAFLSAYDENAEFTFSITALQHGHFTKFNRTDIAITNFTLTDVLGGIISFTQIGDDAPSYNVTLNSGKFVTDPVPANVTFIKNTPKSPAENGDSANSNTMIAILASVGSISAVAGMILCYLRCRSKISLDRSDRSQGIALQRLSIFAKGDEKVSVNSASEPFLGSSFGVKAL